MAAKLRFRNGAWWAVVHYKGRRKLKKIGLDKREAQRVVHKINAALALGKWEPDDRKRTAMPIDQALWDWFNAYRPTFSASFETGAKINIEKHLIPFFGTTDLRDIAEADVLRFIQTKLDAERAPATISNILSVLRRVLNLKRREGVIQRNPLENLGELMRRVDRRQAREVRQIDAWTREEVATLLNLSQENEPRFHPLLMFLLSTGCRKGEALGLQWQDVSLSEGRAWIRRAVVHGTPTTPKSGKARSVVLSPALVQTLRELREQRRREVMENGWKDVPDWVFCDENGGTLDERNLHRSWNRLRRRARNHDVRPLTLHCARHTFASLALASGKSIRWVASQLGHANPELTLRVYAHAMRSEEEDLSFLDFGSTKRHPRGTDGREPSARKKPLRITPRRGSRIMEHETGLEPATTTLATWSSTN